MHGVGFLRGGVLLSYAKGERDAGEMKAMAFYHSSQAGFSVGLQGSVVGSVYTSFYHCEVI